MVTSPAESGIFYLLSANKKDTLYRGMLSTPENSDYSSTTTRIADFSAFSAIGEYVLFVKDAGYSYPFSIRSNIHHALSRASLKSYYYQRMSMPILPQYAGKWVRQAGHPDKEVLVHPSAASKRRPAHTVKRIFPKPATACRILLMKSCTTCDGCLPCRTPMMAVYTTNAPMPLSIKW